MDWAELLKVVGPIIAGAGALVAATRYVTNLQAKLEFAEKERESKISEAKLEQDLALQKAQHELKVQQLQEKFDRLAENNRDMEERYRKLLDAGSVSIALKSSIDEELNQAATRVAAAACSILIAAPSIVAEEKPDALVFLSLFPDQPALRRERIPMKSVAGQVFESEKSLVTNPLPSSFSGSTDKVAQFKTETLLAVPLFHKRRCVGVVEFLNKRGELPFDLSDKDAAEEAAGILGPKVGEFIQDARNLKILGITPRQNATDATILFSDISNSSELATNLDASIVIDLLNQYFEELCEVGMRHGGTVDQFLGDGFMMTFNVKRPLADHRVAAVEAGFEMQQRFQELKSKWTTLQYRGMPKIHNRIGITSGQVHKAEVGHSQFRQITVMGDPVNLANHLCESGSRDRDVIIVGEALYNRLPRSSSAIELHLPRAKRESERAFELAVLVGKP
jgi:class 3 adenylate cyclase